MIIDVAFLPRPRPRDLADGQLHGRAVVVFDVLRATTTMAAALVAGVCEIRIFESLEAARSAAERHGGGWVLCGEEKCLKPAGFDIGNRPGEFNATHSGKTVFMCTTNGTRAIVAAAGSAMVVIGALVNARATARAVAASGLDVMLLCAGTDGAVALEDVIGAGAVAEALLGAVAEVGLTDAAAVALAAYRQRRGDLAAALRESQGGKNLLRAGLAEDIAFAAREDVLDVVGWVREGPLRVVGLA